jgi:ATP-dependent exoDNAse (exonuclease V) beta subunit
LKKEQIPFHFLAQKTDNKALLSYLPGDFVSTINKIRNLSVYGAVEYLTNFYKLYQNADYHPYLQAFKDLVHDFNLNKTSHFRSFIDWWDSTGITKTITINEQQDAIKIITIHKSKGLQYKAVLLPFCNWNLDHEPNLTNIMWCHPGREPFDQIEKLPVRYSSKLVNTIFKDEYDEEKLNAYVDNINLLYVAFTRSIKVLIAFCVKKESGEKNREKLNGISDFIYNALNGEGFSGKAGSWIKDEMRYVYGKINQQNATQKISSNPDSIYTSVPLFERFEFSKQSGDYFNVSSALENKVEYGKLMHRVFQMIYTEKDIPKSIDLLVSEGKINKEESGMLQSKIHSVLNKYKENGWFREKYKIRNEPEIIMEDGKTCRPDRVMEDNDKIIVIDYKFGELEEEKHRRQVRSYMESIKKMDYHKKTEGFVWYVDLDILKKIE